MANLYAHCCANSTDVRTICNPNNESIWSAFGSTIGHTDCCTKRIAFSDTNNNTHDYTHRFTNSIAHCYTNSNTIGNANGIAIGRTHRSTLRIAVRIAYCNSNRLTNSFANCTTNCFAYGATVCDSNSGTISNNYDNCHHGDHNNVYSHVPQFIGGNDCAHRSPCQWLV